MNFIVYSRMQAEAANHEDTKHVIISISLPGDPDGPAKLRTNKDTLGVLQLTFWDIDNTTGLDEVTKLQLFEPRHARAILAFTEMYPEAELTIVHCDAGLSRSPGVAAALSKIQTGDDSYFFKRHSGLNRRVYRMILDEYMNNVPPYP